MTPEDVPGDLVRLATDGRLLIEMRSALARVLPEHERQVRDRVAAEIEADRDSMVGGLRKSNRSVYDRAAQIARGGS